MTILLSLLLSLRLVLAPALADTPPAPAISAPAISAPAISARAPLPEGWITAEGPWLRVHAAPGDQRVADRLVAAGSRQLPELSARLGLPVGAPVEVYVAPTEQAFRTLQPGATPDWADGTAWPRQGLVFLRSPAIRSGTAAPLEQVLMHELAHVLVGRAFVKPPGERGPGDPPRWLQEGVALYLAGEVTADRQELLRRQLPGALLSFAQLDEGFPDDPLTAQLAYAQSGDLIGMIAAERGEAAIGVLIRELAAGEPMPVALRRATGESPVRLEDRWRARWSDPWQKIPSLGELALYAAGIGAMGIALWRLRRRQARILARWEQEEALEARYLQSRGSQKQSWEQPWDPPARPQGRRVRWRTGLPGHDPLEYRWTQ